MEERDSNPPEYPSDQVPAAVPPESPPPFVDYESAPEYTSSSSQPRPEKNPPQTHATRSKEIKHMDHVGFLLKGVNFCDIAVSDLEGTQDPLYFYDHSIARNTITFHRGSSNQHPILFNVHVTTYWTKPDLYTLKPNHTEFHEATNMEERITIQITKTMSATRLEFTWQGVVYAWISSSTSGHLRLTLAPDSDKIIAALKPSSNLFTARTGTLRVLATYSDISFRDVIVATCCIAYSYCQNDEVVGAYG
jgi:hypothetical protein